jgi:hypothetical protein
MLKQLLTFDYSEQPSASLPFRTSHIFLRRTCNPIEQFDQLSLLNVACPCYWTRIVLFHLGLGVQLHIHRE